MSEQVLGRPSIRVSELDENSSRYDKLLAAPSDEELQQVWTTWSAVFFVTSSFNLLVFLSIACTKRIRQAALNKYLMGVRQYTHRLARRSIVYLPNIFSFGVTTHKYVCYSYPDDDTRRGLHHV